MDTPPTTTTTIIIGVIAGVVVFGGAGLWLFASIRRSLQRLREVWTAFAAARRWELTWPRRPVWAIDFGPEAPRMRGAIEGVPVEIELTERGLHATAVRVPIAVPADTPPGATVPEDAVEPAARKLWAQIQAQRGGAVLQVWPEVTPGSPPRRTGGHRLTVGWKGRESEAALLDAAVALAVALARRPPSRLGPGAKYVPYYMRD